MTVSHLSLIHSTLLSFTVILYVKFFILYAVVNKMLYVLCLTHANLESVLLWCCGLPLNNEFLKDLLLGILESCAPIKTAVILSFRQLQLYKLNQAPKEDFSSVRTSQANVLESKPDYQKIVDGQGEVFNCVELVVSGRDQPEF